MLVLKVANNFKESAAQSFFDLNILKTFMWGCNLYV